MLISIYPDICYFVAFSLSLLPKVSSQYHFLFVWTTKHYFCLQVCGLLTFLYIKIYLFYFLSEKFFLYTRFWFSCFSFGHAKNVASLKSSDLNWFLSDSWLCLQWEPPVQRYRARWPSCYGDAQPEEASCKGAELYESGPWAQAPTPGDRVFWKKTR